MRYAKSKCSRYAEIARDYGVDAVITLSNQLAPLPSHVPYVLPKRLSNRVALFHVSWISILTQASLILRDSDELNRDQAFLLNEMARYFEHPHSGVKRFDQMNSEWRPLVLGTRHDQQFKRSSPEIGKYGCELASGRTRLMPDIEPSYWQTGQYPPFSQASGRCGTSAPRCMRFVDCITGVALCLQHTEYCQRSRSNSKLTTPNDFLFHEAQCSG